MIDERAIVNGIVGLLATGGSTNHTIHLVAIAAAAGIHIDWTDFDELSAEVPLLTRIYPNGSADVNHFHAAGGMGFLIRELLDAGLMHDDVTTVMGRACAPTPASPGSTARSLPGRMRRPRASTRRCCAVPTIPSAPMAACACWPAMSAGR